MNKYVIMVSPNNFPQGDAGAIRDEQFAKIYQYLGYDIFYIGMNPYIKESDYKKIKVFSLYSKKRSILEKAKNYIIYPKQLLRLISEIESNNGKPAIIHFYDLPLLGIQAIQKFARKNKTIAIHDSVEWYSPCEFRFGVLSYQYIFKNLTNTIVLKKPTRIIAISSYLYNYFLKKGFNVKRIPAILDEKDYHHVSKHKSERIIKLVYVGSPAKKDLLENCIRGFSLLNKEKQKRFTFDIYGADDTYFNNYAKDDISGICFHGRVPHSEAIRALERSDFCLFVRPQNERYSKAGFPTKVVESMMCGCIPLCNLTSDLDYYLKDGENSVIINTHKIEDIIFALERISIMETYKVNEMKRNARQSAVRYFDYRNYESEIESIIKKDLRRKNHGL